MTFDEETRYTTTTATSLSQILHINMFGVASRRVLNSAAPAYASSSNGLISLISMRCMSSIPSTMKVRDCGFCIDDVLVGASRGGSFS